MVLGVLHQSIRFRLFTSLLSFAGDEEAASIHEETWPTELPSRQVRELCSVIQLAQNHSSK